MLMERLLGERKTLMYRNSPPEILFAQMTNMLLIGTKINMAYVVYYFFFSAGAKIIQIYIYTVMLYRTIIQQACLIQ